MLILRRRLLFYMYLLMCFLAYVLEIVLINKTAQLAGCFSEVSFESEPAKGDSVPERIKKQLNDIIGILQVLLGSA